MEEVLEVSDPEARRLAMQKLAAQHDYMRRLRHSQVEGGGERGGVVPQAPRRRLDRTWEVEQELDFESRTAVDEAMEASKEKAVAELCPEDSHRALARQEPPVSPIASVQNRPFEDSASLRRLKQLEGDVACSIERECGIDVSRGVDVFRLVLLNSERHLRPSTRVLLIAQEAFLCEDPQASVALESCRSGVTEARSQSWIEVQLRFFRATPKTGGRLGSNLPVLHLILSMEDGTTQVMEFIGKHQRQYYSEEASVACDAIAQHLEESLLRVALEFVFHPSRRRFARELVVFRECSVEPEALERRAELLPRMLETLRSHSSIRDVQLEFGGTFARPKQKEKSFVVLDEDVLKVAPAKEQMKAAARGKATFRGFQKGFLNKDTGSRREETASAAAREASDLRQTSVSAVPPDAPPVSSSWEEKQRLLMPAAAPAPGAAAHHALVSHLAVEPAEPEEEPEELGEALDLSQLATQLFGEAEESGANGPDEEAHGGCPSRTASFRCAAKRAWPRAKRRRAPPRRGPVETSGALEGGLQALAAGRTSLAQSLLLRAEPMADPGVRISANSRASEARPQNFRGKGCRGKAGRCLWRFLQQPENTLYLKIYTRVPQVMCALFVSLIFLVLGGGFAFAILVQ
eukprot:g10374.t1